MKLNPYSFLYCGFFKFWENKTEYQDRISFGVQSFFAVGLIIYLLVLGITLDKYFHISTKIAIDKFTFGIIGTVIYFGLNYLIFDRNERYKKLLEKYDQISIFEKIFHYIFWIFILFLPYILKKIGS